MAYGDGRVYPRGQIYWAQWYENGKTNRKSTKKRTEIEARKFLRDRLYEASHGISAPTGANKLTMTDLFKLTVDDYELNGYKSGNLSTRLKHLLPEVGHLRPDQLTSDRAKAYATKRKTQGAANATVNRELSVIIRSFTLASESTPPKVTRIPKITRLAENNVRQGFLTDSEFERLATACMKRGVWLIGILLVGFTYGWRSDEITSLLTVEQVDLIRHCLMLPPNKTKNNESRIVKFMPGSALEKVLVACCKGKKPWQPVFTRADGSQVKCFRGSWHLACVEAGLGHWICKTCKTQLHEGHFCPECNQRITLEKRGYSGLLVHDLRRTAARNARSAGVAETVIMKMGGWKTRSVFIRYAIVDESDQDQAIRKIEQRRARISGRPSRPETLYEPELSPTELEDSSTYGSAAEEESTISRVQNYVLGDAWEDILENLLSGHQTSGESLDANSLYEEVWAKPVSIVAKKYRISGKGLAKRCLRLGVPVPPRGYWAKLLAGKPVPQRLPLSKARRSRS